MGKMQIYNGNVQGMTALAIQCVSGVHFKAEVEYSVHRLRAVSQKMHPGSAPNALWGQQASHAQGEVTASANALFWAPVLSHGKPTGLYWPVMQTSASPQFQLLTLKLTYSLPAQVGWCDNATFTHTEEL